MFMMIFSLFRSDLKLTKQIGAGGFARVHSAQWKGRAVAVKEFLDPKVRCMRACVWRSLYVCDISHIGFILCVCVEVVVF